MVDTDLLHARATGMPRVGHYHNGSERQKPTHIDTIFAGFCEACDGSGRDTTGPHNGGVGWGLVGIPQCTGRAEGDGAPGAPGSKGAVRGDVYPSVQGLHPPRPSCPTGRGLEPILAGRSALGVDIVGGVPPPPPRRRLRLRFTRVTERQFCQQLHYNGANKTEISLHSRHFANPEAKREGQGRDADAQHFLFRGGLSGHDLQRSQRRPSLSSRFADFILRPNKSPKTAWDEDRGHFQLFQ